MDKKTYADRCLERAEKAPEGPWVYDKGVIFTKTNPFFLQTLTRERPGDPWEMNEASYFIANARQDVPELVRRLKKACAYLRKSSYTNLRDVADELETPLEE